MRKQQLPCNIFLIFNVNFNFVTNLQFRIVAEFVHLDHTIAFKADVYDNFAVGHGNDSTFNHFVILDCTECLIVSIFQLFPLVLRI